MRMRQDLPLSDEELAAVEDGLGAYEQLLARLEDVPTPRELKRRGPALPVLQSPAALAEGAPS